MVLQKTYKTHWAKIGEGHIEAGQESTKRQRLFSVHSRGTEPERKQRGEFLKIHTLKKSTNISG